MCALHAYRTTSPKTLLTLLSLAIAVIFAPGRAQAIDVGAPAPDFSAQSLEKDEVTLSSLKGKVVYLDFWATWCAPCRLSLPWMSELQKRHAAAGLEVLVINEDSSREKAERTLRELSPAFKALFDRNGEIAARYALPGMPSSYLIGRDGKVRYIHKGFRESDLPELERRIEELLKES